MTYRGYVLEVSAETGETRIFDAHGEHIDTAFSRGEAEKVIDGWLNAR